ncbi:apolipoprotein N-acyltransferase [Stappia sp. F7233]|uniref:Apolipoprotein N-acyltransferase n=1 Tax=Stappia albiluteola TaxID=2758565 RepID=A0A839AAD8_9HYPH|nr:apolipoprotein N-acyltransferase [Stappia albiluteola]MBA5776085.1 apolipoprotein N-acyltransferase [Stappia albiluteola]
MQRLSHVFLLAWGWRRWGLALFAGAASALSLAPLGWFAVLWLTFPALVWLLDGAIAAEGTGRRRFRPAMAVGWWFGFGYHLAGLWWIGRAFLVDAEAFAWLLPAAVLAMPAGLALFSALSGAIAALFWRSGWPRIVVLAFALSLTDWLRGTILTGFPWNTFGQAFAGNLVLVQGASIVGAYGLGFLAILIFAAPAVLADEAPGRRIFAGLAALLLALMAGFGFFRLSQESPGEVADTAIRIVQPAIPQEEKWLPENRANVFSTYVEMSGRPFPEALAGASRRLTIWPESAVPFLLTEEPGALAAIAGFLKPGETLVTGAIRSEIRGEQRVFYNSIFSIADDGTIVDAYDKVRLVPFGEYVPLEGFFEALGIRGLVQGAGTFEAGFRQRPMRLDGLPAFLPLVCYEIIFPGIASTSEEEAGWILNVTNDAWFGMTAGPYQHLVQARLRAVEQGMPVIRAANTGISAIFDSRGRILDRLELGVRGAIDAALPARLPPTFYARHGLSLFFIALLVSFGFIFILRLKINTRND